MDEIVEVMGTYIILIGGYGRSSMIKVDGGLEDLQIMAYGWPHRGVERFHEQDLTQKDSQKKHMRMGCGI